MFKTLNFKALFFATGFTIFLSIAIVLGSRRLQNFDAALIAYLFGAIFASFGIVYRYVVWLQRPPTRLYWRRGWRLFFSRKFLVLGWALVVHFFYDIVLQKFVLARGRERWIGHMLMAVGSLLAFAVTLPMTFGWIYFDLKPGTPLTYSAFFWGFPVFEFQLNTSIAYTMFHVLDWASFAVILGVSIIIRRRLKNPAMIALQTFEEDWLPLILLLVISITGLGLTWDYEFMQGKAHQFMAITHAITVILFLTWLPFGKFFHIFQRPAQLGIAIYRKAGQLGKQSICPHTKQAFASEMHVGDLKTITKELGFDYAKSDGTSHLDLSPQGKRAALARAHQAARKKSYFG